MKKPKWARMKPQTRWALVTQGGFRVSGMHLIRSAAKRELTSTTELPGSECRIAKVRIEEVRRGR